MSCLFFIWTVERCLMCLAHCFGTLLFLMWCRIFILGYHARALHSHPTPYVCWIVEILHSLSFFNWVWNETVFVFHFSGFDCDICASFVPCIALFLTKVLEDPESTNPNSTLYLLPSACVAISVSAPLLYSLSSLYVFIFHRQNAQVFVGVPLHVHHH